AALIYPGSELTESGDELTPCEYFGGLHIECVPCDTSGNTVPLLFIEVGHAENYGYDDLDKNEAKDISFFDRCTSSEFENFNGLVKYPSGTKVGSYDLNADSCYPAAAATTDKAAGQNKYAAAEIVNRYYHASLVVTKRDSDTEEPVSGAVYGLYATKDDLSSLISTAITDENGKARFDTAAAANTVYYLKEIESPKGYALDNDWHEIVFAPGNIEQNLVLDSDFGDFGTDTQDEPYKLNIIVNKND
ncbi:prealbumin-like fold domain-containing protein, partial [Ruminococcus sp. 210702-SL.1.03]|uniref:prealbumin-like fold domain-containing protein n=1 Tax=Ruminococcus sp. 210702-SL.1.03 TaxID=2883233 RepID=UPI001D06D181